MSVVGWKKGTGNSLVKLLGDLTGTSNEYRVERWMAGNESEIRILKPGCNLVCS